MRNFQSIIFIWTQTYAEVFKSALVYLWKLKKLPRVMFTFIKSYTHDHTWIMRETQFRISFKKQQNADMGNLYSELTDSSSQFEYYYSDIADTETYNKKDVPQETIFSCFRKVCKESYKNEPKKKLLIRNITLK